MSPPPLAFTLWTRRDWSRNLAAAIAVTVFISASYLGSQKIDLRPIHWLTPTAFDRAIPADPRAIYLYVTFYPLLWLTGLLCDRSRFRRYVVALVSTAALSCLLFIFIPTGVARGEIDALTAPALYRLIESTDLPRNALPSEHASLSVIAGILCWQALRGRPALRVVAMLWIGLILWSTLATRQHVLADLLSGAVLGTLAWRATTLLRTENGRFPRQDSLAGNQRETPKSRKKSTDQTAPFNTE